MCSDTDPVLSVLPRLDATANPVLSLEKYNVAIAQPPRGREATDSGTYDDDLFVHTHPL